MSEALDKVQGIRHLPIFPLPLVMLPGELLPLHIFEDRYRKMLEDISGDKNIFGITLFESHESPVDRPPVGCIGCAAEVRDVDTLPDGRSNILTTGLARFRVIDYVEAGEPYLIGDVEFFEDDPEPEQDLNPLADEVFDLFERIAKAAFKIGGSRGRFPEIERTDPQALSFLVTAAFNFDNEKKYNLLELTSTSKRLNELKQVLERAVGQMEESADIQAASRLNGHGKKKIDI